MKLVSGWLVVSSLSILLVSCTGAPAGPPKLPQSASFGWKLIGITEAKPEAAPELLRQAGFRNSWRAEYEGPGTAHVDIYSLKSQAAGLDLTQHWRASAQTVTVFNANYFAVITWTGANRAAATALVGQIERSLPHSD